MMLQIKRCPHCGKVYESGQYREKIGKPVVTCPFCLKPLIDKHSNEWQLLGLGGKIYYIFSVLMTIFITGMLSGMIILLITLLPDIFLKTHVGDFITSGGNGVIILWIICLILSAVYILIREGRDISASNMRMKDPAYLQLLETAGLLKK